ncbi:MAG: hypothetical protein JW836_00250 [Deltaproteobacteria bacterium]|nr:hypothetical protein [Deltaproteobacteria bacterium]
MVAALKTGMDEKTARKCIRAVKPCVANPPADAYKGIAPPAVALDSDVTSSLKSNPKASAGSTKR